MSKTTEATEKAVARTSVKEIVDNLMKSTGKSEAECRAMAGFPPPPANLPGKNVTIPVPEDALERFDKIAAARLVKRPVVIVSALLEWLDNYKGEAVAVD